ncbi:DUF3054 domain-containing protein [Haloarchaeobius sp. HME9146]|uniref:DUF3054 domain-containing protein n=1 Tax=Haloarchaeobius sp. HME9146 TaxID=2978732 RepID=UPI0021BEF2CF|nr:DUF3054 domain-containing protein [Haloarchaeobius sp. HME9146]MCT9096493.1 DUF3054 domain-containing protein [Haloarchaeobius sp. HME9146]
MSTAQRLFGLDARPLSAVWKLAGADLVVLVALITAGELRHGVNPITAPVAVAETMFPFLVGWFLVATLVGAYGDRAFAGGVESARLAAGAWIGGANIGLMLRASPYFSGNSPWTFMLVMTGLGAVTFGIARPLVVRWLVE